MANSFADGLAALVPAAPAPVAVRMAIPAAPPAAMPAAAATPTPPGSIPAPAPTAVPAAAPKPSFADGLNALVPATPPAPAKPSFADGLNALVPVDGTAKNAAKQFATNLTTPFTAIPGAMAVADSAYQNNKIADAKSNLQDQSTAVATTAANAQNPNLTPAQNQHAADMLPFLQRLDTSSDQTNAAAPPPGPIKDSWLYKFGAALKQGVEDHIGKLDPNNHDLTGQIFGMMGNVTGYIGATALGTAVGGPAGGLAVAGGLGAAQNSDAQAQAAIDAGASDENVRRAGEWGGVAGLAMAVPIMGAFKYMPDKIKGAVANAFIRQVSSVVSKAGVDAGTMAIQQIANNLIAQTQYDPSRKTSEGVGQAATLGAFMGVFTHAASAVLGHKNTGQVENVSKGTSDEQAAALSGKPVIPAEPATNATSAAGADNTAPVTPEQKVALGVKPNKMDIIAAAKAKSAANPEVSTSAPVTPEVAAAVAAEHATEANGQPNLPPVGEIKPPAGATKTVQDQLTALADPKQKSTKGVFVPNGVEGLTIPEGANIRTEKTDAGTIYYNNRKGASKDSVSAAKKAGTLGEHLGIGPHTQAELAPAPTEAPTEAIPASPTAEAAAALPPAPGEAPPSRAAAALTDLNAAQPPAVEPPPVASKPVDASPEPNPVANQAPAPPTAPFHVEVTPDGKRQIFIPPDAETQALINARERENDTQISSAKNTDALLANEDAHIEAQDAAKARLDQGGLGAEEEARARLGDSHAAKARQEAIVKSAVEADKMRTEASAQEIPQIRKLSDLQKTSARLISLVREARERGVILPNNVTSATPNAVRWLAQARTTVAKIQRMGRTSSEEAQLAIMDEVMQFLGDEHVYLKTGDPSGFAETRQEVGGERGRSSSEANIENMPDDYDAMEGEAAAIHPAEPEYTAGIEAQGHMPSAEDLLLQGHKSETPEPSAKKAADDGTPAYTAGEAKKPVVEVKKSRAIKKPTPSGKAAEAVATSKAKEEPAQQKSLPRKTQSDVGTPVARGDQGTIAERTMTFEEASNHWSSSKMLDTIQDTTKNPLLGRVLSRVTGPVLRMLNTAVKDVKVHVLSDANFEANGGDGAGAYYDPIGDMIVVPHSLTENPTEMAYTLMHEGAHAVLWHALDTSEHAKTPEGRQLFNDVDTLRRGAMKAFDALPMDEQDRLAGVGEDLYAISNNHEFLSEAISNPKVQEFLSQLPLGKEELAALKITPAERHSIRTFMHVIVSHLAGLLHVREALAKIGYGPDTKTSLDATMKIVGHMVELSPEARKTYYTKNAQYADPSIQYARKAYPPPEGHAADLVNAGMPRHAAEEFAQHIKDHFGGKATPEEIKDIAVAYKEATQANKAEAKATRARAQEQVARIQAQSEAAVKEAAANFTPKGNPGKPRFMALAGMDQLAQTGDRYFGEYTNPVRKVEKIWNARQTQKAQTRTELLSKLPEAIRGLKDKYGKSGEFGDMEKLMIDSRFAGAHPHVPLDHELNKHLGKNSLDGAWGRAQHPDLAARYEALPSDLQEHFHNTRDTYTATQNEMAKAAMGETLKAMGHTDPAMAERFFNGKQTEADKQTVGPAVAAHLDKAAELKRVNGPYFPLDRRGDHVVVGRYKLETPAGARALEPNVFEFTDKKAALAYLEKQAQSGAPRTKLNAVWVDKNTGKTTAIEDGENVKVSKNDADAEQRWRATVQDKHVEFHDTRAQAVARQAELRKAGLQVNDVEPKAYQRNARNGEMLSDQMKAISATIEQRAQMEHLSPAQKQELQTMLQEISLRFLGNTRVQSHRIPTAFVEGASSDSLRSLYDYADSAAGYLTKLRTQGALNDAMKEMTERQKLLTQQGKGGGEGARALVNEVEKRVLDPSYSDKDNGLGKFANRLATVTFLRHLMSPSYTLFNLMQPLLFTKPMLSGRHGYGRSWGAFIKAYHDVSALKTVGAGVSDTMRAFAKHPNRNYLDDIIAGLKDPGERAMLKRLGDDGTIASDSGIEAAAVQKNSHTMVGKGFDVASNYLDHIARAAPAAAEAVNRTVSALAAYRLELRKNGGNAEHAEQYARDIVRNTQFDYSSSNTAPALNNPLARTVLQFKKFALGAYYLMGRQLRQAVMNGPGGRAQAVKSLAYMMATHQLAAGTLGLGGLEIAKLGMMALNGAGLTNVTYSDFQDMVQGFYQKILGKKMGDMAANGLSRGIPGGWGFDMLSRIGLDSLLTFGEPRGNKTNDWKAYAFDLISGAPVGTLADAFSGVGHLANGDIAGAAEKLLPLKWAADAVKGADSYHHGKFNMQDAILRSVGLTSDRQAEMGNDTGAKIRANAAKKEAFSAVESAYINALTPADRARALQGIQKYNLKPPNGKKISINGLEKLRLQNVQKYAN